jgi:hypothetical protein
MKERMQVAKAQGVSFDVRGRFEVIMDLRAKGIDAVGTALPRSAMRSPFKVNGIRILPLGGISNKVTVLCNEAGFHLVYKSDEHGFHNPAQLWPNADLVAVGDSFAMGHCVPSDKNFVSLIRSRYPKTINLGMSGNGPLVELGAIKEYAPLLKPKVVLWFYFGNDIENLEEEKENEILLRYLDDDKFTQSLLARQQEIDPALSAEFERQLEIEMARKRASKSPVLDAYAFVKLQSLRQRLGLTSPNSRAVRNRAEIQPTTMELFEKVLSTAKNTVAELGATLYFIYLPGYYGSNPKKNEPILGIVRGLGISIIDITPVFAQHDRLSLFPFGLFGHYNEKGHRLVAEEVLKTLEMNRQRGS